MEIGDYVTLLLGGTDLRNYDGDVATVVRTTPSVFRFGPVYGVRLVASENTMHLYGQHLRPSTDVEILAAKLRG